MSGEVWISLALCFLAATRQALTAHLCSNTTLGQSNNCTTEQALNVFNDTVQSFLENLHDGISEEFMKGAFTYDIQGQPLMYVNGAQIKTLSALLMEHDALLNHRDWPGHETTIPKENQYKKNNNSINGTSCDRGIAEDGHILAKSIDASLTGHVHPNDEELLKQMINQTPKLVRKRRAYFNGANPPWPNGTIYYVFDEKIHKESKAKALSAQRSIMSRVPCIKFVPVTPNSPVAFILITDQGSGCWAEVIGYREGQTIINLSYPTCLSKYAHEFFHVLGLEHEQKRPDRDDYVEIKWSNIDGKQYPQFWKSRYPINESAYGEYDYGSLVHYSPTAFHINRTIPTIKVKPGKDGYLLKSGNEYISPNDYNGLRERYGCPGELESDKTYNQVVRYNMDRSERKEKHKTEKKELRDELNKVLEGMTDEEKEAAKREMEERAQEMLKTYTREKEGRNRQRAEEGLSNLDGLDLKELMLRIKIDFATNIYKLHKKGQEEEQSNLQEKEQEEERLKMFRELEQERERAKERERQRVKERVKEREKEREEGQVKERIEMFQELEQERERAKEREKEREREREKEQLEMFRELEQERERVEKEQEKEQEKERLAMDQEKERLEMFRELEQERERVKKERLKKEQEEERLEMFRELEQERKRVEKEQERERVKKEREKERLEMKQLEVEREKERLEMEREKKQEKKQEKERLAMDQEKERLEMFRELEQERERVKKERLKKEQEEERLEMFRELEQERERVEKEQERERVKKEKLKKEREKERLEMKRLEVKREKERLEMEREKEQEKKQEKERVKKERFKNEREKERLEMKRLEVEREKERLVMEREKEQEKKQEEERLKMELLKKVENYAKRKRLLVLLRREFQNKKGGRRSHRRRRPRDTSEDVKHGEMAEAIMRKTVTVSAGNPIILVVSNPNNLPVKWYHVVDGEDYEIEMPYTTERTSGGNEKIVIQDSAQYDGHLFVAQIDMNQTVLRIFWSISLLS